MSKKPNFIKKAANFTKAVSRHAVDGFAKVTLPQYKERLEICNGCEFHENGHCNECGCKLIIKAWWRSENCPIDKWPEE